MSRRYSTKSRYGRRILFLAFPAVCLAAISAPGEDHPAQDADWKVPSRAQRLKNPCAGDNAAAAAGKVIYVQQCLSCHGASGKGDGPQAASISEAPCDLTDPSVTAQVDGALFWKISTGHRPMPEFAKLIPSESDRWNVVTYLRTLAPAGAPATQPSSQPPSQAASPPATAPAPS